MTATYLSKNVEGKGGRQKEEDLLFFHIKKIGLCGQKGAARDRFGNLS